MRRRVEGRTRVRPPPPPPKGAAGVLVPVVLAGGPPPLLLPELWGVAGPLPVPLLAPLPVPPLAAAALGLAAAGAGEEGPWLCVGGGLYEPACTARQGYTQTANL